MIKEIGKLCLRQDPNLPTSLTKDQKSQAHNQPELKELESRRDALSVGLKSKFGLFKNGASTPEFAQRKALMGQLNRGRARAEKELFQRVLREFHDTADLNLMVSQLEGKNTLVGLRPPAEFAFEERQRLSTSLFQETTDISFAQIVDDLCLLCTRQEQSCSDQAPLLQTSSLEQHNLENAASAQVGNCVKTRKDAIGVHCRQLPRARYG